MLEELLERLKEKKKVTRTPVVFMKGHPEVEKAYEELREKKKEINDQLEKLKQSIKSQKTETWEFIESYLVDNGLLEKNFEHNLTIVDGVLFKEEPLSEKDTSASGKTKDCRKKLLELKSHSDLLSLYEQLSECSSYLEKASLEKREAHTRFWEETEAALKEMGKIESTGGVVPLSVHDGYIVLGHDD